MTPAASEHVTPVIGYIPVATARSPVVLSRRGRKSRGEAALHPYTVFQEPKTGGYYIRYTDPVTKKRERKPLAKLGVGQTATTSSSQAERLATALWSERLEKAGRVANGLEPEREVRPAFLLPLFAEYVVKEAFSRKGKQAYVLHMKNVVAFTSFTKLTDVRHIDGPILRKIAAELQAATRCSRRTRFEELPFTEGMVRAHLVTLSAFFSWVAQYHGIGMANPVAVSKILEDYPRSARGDDFFYVPAEVELFLRTVDEAVYTARTIGNREIAYLVAYTGARIGEVLLLRACSIDFNANTVTFVNLKRTREEKAQGLRKTRTMKMWSRLRSVLLEYTRRHRLDGDDVLFPKFVPAPHRKGSRGPRDAGPYEWLKSMCRKAGILYRSGHHVWRHTYVSVRARMQKRLEILGQPGVYAIMAVTMDDVRAEIGHTEGSHVTTRVYNHSQLHLPALAIFELDWPALADAVRRQQAVEQERFGTGYHEADVARMKPLASPANMPLLAVTATHT